MRERLPLKWRMLLGCAGCATHTPFAAAKRGSSGRLAITARKWRRWPLVGQPPVVPRTCQLADALVKGRCPPPARSIRPVVSCGCPCGPFLNPHNILPTPHAHACTRHTAQVPPPHPSSPVLALTSTPPPPPPLPPSESTRPWRLARGCRPRPPMAAVAPATS